MQCLSMQHVSDMMVQYCCDSGSTNKLFCKCFLIIIMVTFKCYSSGKHIALSITKKNKKQQQRCEHRIRKNHQIKCIVHDAN